MFASIWRGSRRRCYFTRAVQRPHPGPGPAPARLAVVTTFAPASAPENRLTEAGYGHGTMR